MMKKLIVFSVIFALIAGAAFAQPSIGGNIKVATRLLSGSTQDGKDDVTAGGTFYNDSHINVNFGSDEAGGMMRIYHRGQTGDNTGVGNNEVPFAFVWWKPIDELRFQLGVNPDGNWGAAQISGWGYHAEAQAGAVVDEWAGTNLLIAAAARNSAFQSKYNATRAFAPGFSAMGLTASVTPIDGLAINVAFPMAHIDNNNGGRSYVSKPAKEVFGDFYANVTYGLEGIGTIRVSFDSELGSEGESTVFGSFYVSAIDNMGIDIGLAYKLLNEGNAKNPLSIGLAYRFADGDFGIKVRSEVALAGDVDVTTIGIGVLPSYNLSSNIAAFLSVGFGVALADDTLVDWFANPYIRIRAANGLQIYTGVKIVGYNKDYSGIDGIDWAVPVLFNMYF